MLDGEVGNSATTPQALTQRQQSVMERIDRRMPIKVIAQELELSETRINQHIRALKDIYGAENLNELVENYRIATGQEGSGVGGEVGEQPAASDSATPYESGLIVGSGPEAPNGVSSIGPAWLNGENAVLWRLAAMVGIAVGILAAVLLVATASIRVSEALEGKANVSRVYNQTSQ